MLKRLLALVAALCAFAAIPASASANCPVGRSQMGCSLPRPVKGVSVVPAGEIVPDVSSYQGTVEWSAVKAWQRSHGWKMTGGIFKLGENVLDPYALRNARALKAASMAAIGYVFVRPGLRASTVIGWARQAGIKVVVLDEEVPGIEGTAGRIVPALKAAGLTVVDYHSAGQVFDTTTNGLPCWVAGYGPSTPPACSTGPRVAWQFTAYGSVPGVTGIVDESISYGLLKLASPSKPKPVCFGRDVQESGLCISVQLRYAWLVAKHRFWQTEFGRCIRYADGIKCGHAQHWEIVRGQQARALRRKYT